MMKKKRIVQAIILFMVISIFYLQYGREMNVTNEHSVTTGGFQSQKITVVLNKAFVRNKEKCGKEIIEKCRNNSFSSMDFCYDYIKPNEIYGTVYLSDLTYNMQKPLFEFTYLQNENATEKYNIINNPDKFHLKIK